MAHAPDPAPHDPSRPDADAAEAVAPARDAGPKPDASTPRPPEVGGPSGPEPTRYGDWERKGRCYDF